MPIRINLLAEALAEEDLRRRDPVKRAIFIGAFLVALSLVWFSSIWLTYMVKKQQLNKVQADIQARTTEFTQVKDNRNKIAEIQKRMDALQQLSAARFLQGTLMNALQQTYVPNVQLTHVRVDQTYSAAAAVPARTNSSGSITPGRPPAITEKIVLTLDAKDYSPSPGDQVNRFKDSLLKQDFFKTGLDLTNGIRLANLSSPQTGPDGKSFVQFNLECRFQERNQ